MTCSQRLQRLLLYSMDFQLFPNLYHYIRSTWPVVDRWLRHHNALTVIPSDWQYFVQQQWLQHKAVSFNRLKYNGAVFINL